MTGQAARQREAQGAKVQDAVRDTYTWVTEYTQTKNEHWLEEGRPSPYEPFPHYDYLAVLFEILDATRIIWIEKSRDLMVSWACVAYLTLKAMKTPECGVLFQAHPPWAKCSESAGWSLVGLVTGNASRRKSGCRS
jgi:hypothetical protein